MTGDVNITTISALLLSASNSSLNLSALSLSASNTSTALTLSAEGPSTALPASVSASSQQAVKVLVSQIQRVCGAYLTAILTVIGFICNLLIVAVMRKEAFKALPVKVNIETCFEWW